MKFLPIVLATVLAAAPSSATAEGIRKTMKSWNHNLRQGRPSTEALLKRSRPYKTDEKRKRYLQEGIDGSYNVKFSSCLNIKTYDKNLFDDEIVQYVQAGQVLSTKSFVLFHACQGNNCYYEAEDDLYIVDLPTYLATAAVYHAEERMNFCEACDHFVNQCTQVQNNGEGGDGEDNAADWEEIDAAAGGDDGVAGDGKHIIGFQAKYSLHAVFSVGSNFLFRIRTNFNKSSFYEFLNCHDRLQKNGSCRQGAELKLSIATNVRHMDVILNKAMQMML